MTKWAKWSIRNCARNWSLTIPTNGICTTQNLSCRMRHKLLWDFDIQTDNLISDKRRDLIIITKKKKRTCQIVDFAVPADHRVKLKESEKKEKYLDLARELKKLQNMKGTVIPIVIGALVTVTKGLVQRLEDLEITGWVETIQTTALLISARILRRVLNTWGDLLSLKLQRFGGKNPKRSNNNNNNNNVWISKGNDI